MWKIVYLPSVNAYITLQVINSVWRGPINVHIYNLQILPCAQKTFTLSNNKQT